MERAQTLKMAKSNAGLVPTNKVLPSPLFLATSQVKSRPLIKVGYRTKGGVNVVNKSCSSFHFFSVVSYIR